MQDPKSVERLRRGDGATLKRLFKANYAKLYPLVYRLTKDEDAANEAIRLTFLRLWEDRKELDPFEVIFLRLMGYAYGNAMEYRAEHGVEGIASGARRPRGEEIAKHLQDVPERERLIYLLNVVDGYSVRELAGAFGTTKESVREAVGRAMTKLEPEQGDSLAEDVQSSRDSELWP